MKPIDVIEFHEERGHEVTKARWWEKLRWYVEKSGKIPPRLLFRAMVVPMYEGKHGRARKKSLNAFAPGRWESLTDPKNVDTEK